MAEGSVDRYERSLQGAVDFVVRGCRRDWRVGPAVRTVAECRETPVAAGSLVLWARTSDEVADCARPGGRLLRRLEEVSRDGGPLHAVLPATSDTLSDLEAASRVLAGVGASSLTFVLSRAPRHEVVGHFDFWAHSVGGFAALAAAKQAAFAAGVELCRFSYAADDQLEHFEHREPASFAHVPASGRCRPQPRVLVVKPQVFCDYACGFCALRKSTYRENIRRQAGSSRPQPGPLTPGEWLELVRDAHEIGCREVLWSGGELMFYKRLGELLPLIAREDRVHHCVDTNASRITKGVLRLWIRSGLREIHLSLDSAEPTVHDRIRGRVGAYQAVIRALQWCTELAQEGEPIESVNVNTVVTRLGYESFPDLLRLVGRYPIVNYQAFSFLEGAYRYHDYTLSAEDIEHFRRQVRPEMLDVLEGLPFATDELRREALANCRRMFTNACASDSEYARGVYWSDTAMVRMFCRIPSSFSLVVQNGDVLPCTGIEEFGEPIVGNIRVTPFARIWHGDDNERFRNMGVSRCHLCPLHHNANLTYGPAGWRHDALGVTPT